MSGSSISKKIILIILAVILVIALLSLRAEKGVRRGVAGIPEPVQTETTGHIEFTKAGYNVRVEYLYEYDIEALVLHTKNYAGIGLGDRLSPKDLALGWGKVAEYNDKIDFNWSQSGRWCNWHTDTYDELNPVGGEAGVDLCSSNNHIIPADSRVKSAIKKIKMGDHVKLKGYLVNIYGSKPNGATFTWCSSTTREDSGDGACEVFYVKEVKQLN